ncbi:MAG: hypothetical protein LBD45_08770 [Bacteroidales bacterium]|jgi:hypothetical protein|nr:hypothetical protein [Bacteroidales bacterium]
MKLNSDGRNQRVGYAGFKLGKVDFSFYNDVIPVLGDQDDRWWTGGGALNIGNFSSATDVFTGIRDPNSYHPEKKGIDRWDPAPGNPAGGRFDTYMQSAYNQQLNSEQTIYGLRGLGNTSISFVIHGQQMWSQDIIHNNFGLPSLPIIEYLNRNRLFHSTAGTTYGIWINTGSGR